MLSHDRVGDPRYVDCQLEFSQWWGHEWRHKPATRSRPYRTWGDGPGNAQVCEFAAVVKPM
jgi:hypothetical protein